MGTIRKEAPSKNRFKEIKKVFADYVHHPVYTNNAQTTCICHHPPDVPEKILHAKQLLSNVSFIA